MLGRKRKEADVFDEPDFEEQASRIPTEEQKQNNRHNVMLSMLKGTMLTYSLAVDSAYDLMRGNFPNKEDFAPLINLVTRLDGSINERLVSKVIKNVEDLLINEDVPLDYMDPEIESSYASISKDTNRVEVNIL